MLCVMTSSGVCGSPTSSSAVCASAVATDRLSTIGSTQAFFISDLLRRLATGCWMPAATMLRGMAGHPRGIAPPAGTMAPQ